MFSSILQDLCHAVGGLETKFITPHLLVVPAVDPATYNLDVRAYLLLSHAALEQFVEDLCLELVSRATDSWENNHHLSEPVLALTAFYSDRLAISDNERDPELTFFDHIRQGLVKAKANYSAYLKKKNNGVSVKYLRQMLLPVGLSVPTDAKWVGSLGQLASYRGDNAYKHRVTKVTDPERAREWVQDCLQMAAQLASDAAKAMFRPAFREDSRNWII
jgi:hypothetical protein